MSWYYSRIGELQNFFSEELNSAPFFAGIHSFVIGGVLAVEGKQLWIGGSLNALHVVLAACVVTYSLWRIFVEHGEFAPRDRRDTIAFIWAIWPSLIVGIIGFTATLYASKLITDNSLFRTIIICMLGTGLFLFCGWMGSMTARHIIHGGRIRWGGIN